MCAEEDGCDKTFISLYEMSPYLPSRVWFYDAIPPRPPPGRHMTPMTERATRQSDPANHDTNSDFPGHNFRHKSDIGWLRLCSGVGLTCMSV